ncbi:CxxC-x17-CxxC domain-containing protein [Candidatus Altiarchaeota archaeon]
MHDAVCSECNSNCQVPFKPTQGKPVYCRECFSSRKPQRW